MFDKALDEPNYSLMYAQLCQRLNEAVPNFEDRESKTTVSWRSRALCVAVVIARTKQERSVVCLSLTTLQTFRRLLLAKCKEEFDNRTGVNASKWIDEENVGRRRDERL